MLPFNRVVARSELTPVAKPSGMTRLFLALWPDPLALRGLGARGRADRAGTLLPAPCAPSSSQSPGRCGSASFSERAQPAGPHAIVENHDRYRPTYS